MADFIRAETIEGIQRLYTLRLQGAPPEDGVVATAEVWVAALKKRFATWHETQDIGRIRSGFDVLLLDVVRWPTPAMLIERIPKRKPPPAIGKRTVFTEAEIQRGKQAVQTALATIMAAQIERNEKWQKN